MFRLPKVPNQSSPKKGVVPFAKNQGLCKYPHRPCVLPTLESYEYCLKHILEDKSAPYKPCPYVYTVSGKKCGKAAYRPDRRDTWLCAEHGRKANLSRQKASTRHAPPQTQESLLTSLAHYVPTTDQPIEVKKEKSENEETAVNVSDQAVNPFMGLDAAQVNARCSQVLDYASDSESDVEPAMLDSVWRAQDHESSDAESVDSQAEDPLKYSGVFTAEEVTVVVKDKMIRLQSLYIDQFRRLHHLLKERRRKYLHSIKKEKETLGTIHQQVKATLSDQKLYKKLKALNHYHRYYGEEAILHKKALERRAQATENNIVRTSHKGKCTFTEGGVKCGAKTLPVTKYCRKHILEDTQQVLFRACGFKRDDHVCQEPTLNVFENATCVYHITLPAQPHNNLDMPDEIKEVKVETANVKDMHEDEVIARTLLDLEASGIQVEENIMKQSDPNVTVFSATEPSGIQAEENIVKPSEPNGAVFCATEATGIQVEENIMKPSEPKGAVFSPAEASGIQAEENIMKPSEPNVAVFSATETVDKEIEQIDISTSQKQSSTENKSEIKETVETVLPPVVTSTVSQQPSQEQTPAASIPEDTGTTVTTEVVTPTNHVSMEIAESIELEESGGSGVCTNQIVEEKMDIDSEVISSYVESPKNESIEEELVMVDMMSDVGVVEEVLESEEKTEPVEIMQAGPESDTGVEKG